MIRLLRLQARRDRIALTIWILTIAVLATASVSAALDLYPSDAQRADTFRLALATPAILVFRGAMNGPSEGSMVMFQSFAWLALTIALMNTFLAVRHGRADEERGRRELIGATPVSRLAPLAATLTLGVLANVVLWP